MQDIRRFLKEDIGGGDVTSESLFGAEKARAAIVAKKECVVAGLEEARMVFRALGLMARCVAKDGGKVRAGTIVLTVEGRAADILKGERLALNFLMRMSGIATETRALVDLCAKAGSKVLVAGTRKTVPGFRKYDKKAIALGGGWPHRMGLYDGVLIKDNHLKLVSITEAVRRASRSRKPIEVEVTDVKQAIEAARAGAHMVMLDNMTPRQAKAVSAVIRNLYPRVKIEISGGITPANIVRYAPYADVISLGHLTHSVKAADFSLDLETVRSGKKLSR